MVSPENMLGTAIENAYKSYAADLGYECYDRATCVCLMSSRVTQARTGGSRKMIGLRARRFAPDTIHGIAVALKSVL